MSLKRVYNRAYYLRNRKKLIRESKEYRERNLGKSKARAKRYYQTHRKESLAKQKIYNKTHKEKHKRIARKSHLKNTFNMTLEGFSKLFAKQHKCCAGCGSKHHRGNGWNIDHDHACCPGKKSCGKCIRGILCAQCNKALGMLRDNVKTLLRLARYLDAERS